MQKYLDGAEGVVETTVGYANGPFLDPTYQQVKNGSGHVETCKVVYDPSVLSLSELLYAFLQVVDPYSLNKQGEDEGVQYRTGIYYVDDEDLKIINESLSTLNNDHKIECFPLKNFSIAEEYHQKYLEKNPDGYCHITCAFRKRK